MNVRHAALLLLVVFGCLVAADPIALAGKKGNDSGLKLHGFVGTSPTTAAADEILVLLDAATGRQVGRTETNMFGKYKFAGLAPGRYLLRVGRVGLEVVLTDRNKRLDIDLSTPGGEVNYVKDGLEEIGRMARLELAGATDPGMMTAMAGTYTAGGEGRSSKLSLCRDGSFREQGGAAGTGNAGTRGHNPLATAAKPEPAMGNWGVHGDPQHGALTLIYDDGREKRIEYRALGNGCYELDGRRACSTPSTECN